MGHQHHGGVALLYDILHQIKNLRLRRHIQRRSGLIRNQQLRITGQRHGNDDPLPHAAGKLMRIGIQPAFRIGNPYFLKQFHRPLPGLCLRHVQMQHDRFCQLVTDRHNRV